MPALIRNNLFLCRRRSCMPVARKTSPT